MAMKNRANLTVGTAGKSKYFMDINFKTLMLKTVTMCF